MKSLEKDDLNKKAENLRLMKLKKKKKKKTNNKFETKKQKNVKIKPYIKLDKKCKDWWYWNWKMQISSAWKPYFHKYFHEIFVFNKVPFGKQDLEYFIGYKRCYKN